MAAIVYDLPVIPAPTTPPPVPLFPEQDSAVALWAQALTAGGYGPEVLIPGPYTSLITAAMADMRAVP